MIDTIIAGDALDFDVTVTDTDGAAYTPADGWSMTLRLLPRTSGTPITIPATASGTDYNVAVTSATTAAWAAGNYSAFALVTLSGQRKTVYIGELVIKADPGTATAYDVRSESKQALDAAMTLWRSYMTDRATVLEYEIAGRRMRFRSASDLLANIDALKREVAREDREQRIALGLGSGTKVYTRFST